MSVSRSARGLFVSAVSVFAACSSGPDYGDAPAGAANQVSVSISLGPPDSEVVLLVLDDEPSALDLRQVGALQLETYAARVLSDPPPCSPNDPARKKPVDRSLVVVHPSAGGDARFTSPADDPALRWREGDASLAGRASWVAAMNSAVSLTPGSAAFQPLAALKSAFELVTAARSAETAAERALVSSLPKPSAIAIVLLAAHEDESPGEPGEYAFTLPVGALFADVILPRATPTDAAVTCGSADSAATARFTAWAQQQHLTASTERWPCQGLTLLSPLSVDCAERCVNWRPTEESDGRATCLLTVDAAVDHCDATLGFLDPMDADGVRRPVQAGGVSTCEIQQPTGAALESCKSTLACSGCEPGWCATQVPELLPECTRGVPLPLRFTGGSNVAVNGTATLLCNVKSVSSY